VGLGAVGVFDEGEGGVIAMLVLTSNRECEMAVRFVDVDIVLVAPNGISKRGRQVILLIALIRAYFWRPPPFRTPEPDGWFSTSAAEVDGSGRTGLGLPFSCQFDPRTSERTRRSIRVCSEFVSDTNRLDSRLDGRPVS
jgi:hypothetical protein